MLREKTTPRGKSTIHSVHRHVLYVLVELLVSAALCEGYSSGAPDDVITCSAMAPTGHGVAAQTAVSPYQITTSTQAYAPGQNITVTIRGSNFKGFLIMARSVNDSSTSLQPLGNFVTVPQITQTTCSGQALTHTSAGSSQSKSSLQLQWIAPSVAMGDIVFQATVVQSRTVFWQDVQSSVLNAVVNLNIAPTSATQVEPTTAMPELNVSTSYENFWVKTVIQVPLTENIKSNEWKRLMEGRLADLYNEGLQREELINRGQYAAFKRRKRYVTVGSATVQMTNTSRKLFPEDIRTTDLVYYMVEGPFTDAELQQGDYYDNITAATRVVYLSSLFQEQEVAIRLGYVVISQAEVYVPVDQDDPMYWIIGAVIGGLLFLGLVIWLILFIYFKCTRSPTAPKTSRSGSMTPRSNQSVLKDVEPRLTDYRKKDGANGYDIIRTDGVGINQEHRAPVSSYSAPDGSQPQVHGRPVKSSSKQRSKRPSAPVTEGQEEPVYAKPKKKKVPTATLR